MPKISNAEGRNISMRIQTIVRTVNMRVYERTGQETDRIGQKIGIKLTDKFSAYRQRSEMRGEESRN